jgi:hypothetical protein
VQDYQGVDREILLDLLSQYTAEYIKLYIENGDPIELGNLKKMIVEIQFEILKKQLPTE